MLPIFKKYPLLSFALFAFALASLYCANSAVIGLDLGGEYMKISSISPGKSFTIVEDTTTKRKTPTAIGFHSNERVYEYDILAKRPRSFQTIFTNLVKYLGKSPSDPKLQEQIKYYLEDYQIVENERGTVSFKLKNFKMSNDDDTNYVLKVEELFGMIFRHIKKLASEQAERQLRDIAVTIPPYWNFKERYALHDALLLADLNPLAFISENTAAALYYGLERQDDKPHTMIMYNLGSTSLKVSLIEFYVQNSTDKVDKGTSIETFRVVAEAWEEDVGGLSFDLGLARHFAKEFDTKPARKGQKSVLTSNPAKAKLLKESNRLKEILSANKQVQLFLENLFESTDLKYVFDRNKFEEVNQELLAKLTKPIDEVLAKTGKTLADIDAFELIGGGVRVPKVQQILADYLQGKEVGTHLNGDESMTLGAAFHAANLSSSFKTRQIYINDGYNFDIRVELRDLEEERLANTAEDATKLEKQAVLFPYKTRYGSKKVLAFEYDGDINATFYAKLTGQETEENVISFEVTGLKQAREDPKFEGKDLNPPKVHLHFRLSYLGFIELTKAEAVIEEIVLYEDTKNSTKTETAETTKSADTDAGETGEANTEADDEKSQEPEKKFKRKTITHTIPLKINTVLPKPGPMTEEERELSRDILSKFDHYEQQKRKTAEAKNRLEAFLYSTRDSLEDEGFSISAQEEEKEQLKQLLEEHSEWLGSDEAYKSNHMPFQKRFDEMNKIFSKIQHRFEQRVKRPEAIEKARGYLKDFISKVSEVNVTKSWISSEVIQEAIQKIENIGHWITEHIQKQELLAHHEDPVLTTNVLMTQLDKAKEIYNKLKNTVKPKPPKNGTSTDDLQFQEFMGKDGKFDEEKLKEYFKKMNITYPENKTKDEEEPKDDTIINPDETEQQQTSSEEPTSQDQDQNQDQDQDQAGEKQDKKEKPANTDL